MPQDLPPRERRLPLVTDLDALTNFINSLGLQGDVPPMEAMPLVLPVAVVANPVRQQITSVETPFTAATVFTAGLLTNQAAGSRYADTGQLAAGDFSIKLFLSGSNTAGSDQFNVRIRHRDSADAADLMTFEICFAVPIQDTIFQPVLDFPYTFGLNERLVAENVSATSATTTATMVIFAVRI